MGNAAYLKDLAKWTNGYANAYNDNKARAFTVQAGKNIDDVDVRLIAAINQIGIDYGVKITITSGYRSIDDQRDMQNAWDRGERSGLVERPADPGSSWHNYGGAVDILINGRYPNSSTYDFSNQKLYQPYPSNDPVHFQLIDTKDQNAKTYGPGYQDSITTWGEIGK